MDNQVPKENDQATDATQAPEDGAKAPSSGAAKALRAATAKSAKVVRQMLLSFLVISAIAVWSMPAIAVYRRVAVRDVTPVGQDTTLLLRQDTTFRKGSEVKYAQPEAVLTPPDAPLRDPFKPTLVEKTDKARREQIVQQKQVAEQFHLAMTVLTPRGKWAVINAYVYKEGESVDGFRLEGVSARGARLVKGGTVYLLEMEGDK